MSYDKKTFTQSDLLTMGWSKGLIEKLLPKPILKGRGTSKSSTAAPIKLWYASTVYKQMRHPDFRAAQEKAKSRKVAARKAVATKEEKLINRAAELAAQLKIRIVDDNDLRIAAIENWERHYTGSEPFMTILDHADKTTVDHQIVNYIRHKLIDYDKECTELLTGRVGCRPAYIVFKKAILLRIAEAYPKYSEACMEQHRTVHVPKWRCR